MKKLVLVLAVTMLSISLAGCSPNSNTSKSATDKATSEPAEKATSSFKDSVFKTKEYSLTITKEQVVKDKQQGDTGLIVWYTVKNIGKGNNVTGTDSIANLTFSQSDGSSIAELQDGFDAAGALYPDGSNNEQIDKYNAMNKLQEKADSKILPGKTVETFNAYELDNATHAVTVKAVDPKTLKKVGSMTIKLK